MVTKYDEEFFSGLRPFVAQLCVGSPTHCFGARVG